MNRRVGVYFCMKYQITEMLKHGKDAMVNLASIAGLNGIPWAGPYASTKHALVGLTKSSALDHATQGIRVNAVAPGAIRTDILAKQLDGGDPNYNEASISAMHPMNRLGKFEEVANAICWLLSDCPRRCNCPVLKVQNRNISVITAVAFTLARERTA